MLHNRHRPLCRAGTVRFEVTGGLGERFLDACAQNGIPVQEIKPTPTGFTARVPVRDYPRLHRPARAARCRLRVRERRGVCFLLAPYTGHTAGLLAGLAAAAVLLSLCGGLIWNITFYDFAPDEQRALRAQLFECGICEGARADAASLDAAAREIFIRSPQYGWIHFNFIRGRLAVEKVDRAQRPDIMPRTVTNVVAVSDGTIVRQVIADGFALKRKGQSVARGEVLISGTAVGTTGAQLFAHAMGQVYAQVERTYVYTQPLEAAARVPGPAEARYTSLLLAGKKAVPLYLGAIPDEGERAVVHSALAPFGFHLPATLETVELRRGQLVSTRRTPQLARDEARMQIFDAVQQELGPYELLESSEQVRATQDAVELTMHLKLIANIAKMVPLAD